MLIKKVSRRDQSTNFCRARSLGRIQKTSVPSLFSFLSSCLRYLKPEMRWTFSRRSRRHSTTIKPLSAIARSAATSARWYISSSRNRAKQVPDGATRIPPSRDINATASSTSPLKNWIPRIWQVEKLETSDTRNVLTRLSRARSVRLQENKCDTARHPAWPASNPSALRAHRRKNQATASGALRLRPIACERADTACRRDHK